MDAPLFACALSTDSSSARAENEAVEKLLAALGGARPDLLLAFATHHHGSALEELGQRLQRRTGARAVLGCTGESVIGGAREIEHEPALALWSASMPGTRVELFRCEARPTSEGAAEFVGLPQVPDPAHSSLLVLGEPFSFPMDEFLALLNERWPGLPAIGGMASGGSGPGQNLLFTHEGVREAGLVGALIEGAVEVRSVVSQGCRPVGKPWVVTGCEKNLMLKLGGLPALDALMETWQALPADDQELFRRAPFVGLAIDARKSEFARGDFLVRGIIGFSRESKAIAVADLLRRGQSVQFLVRDAASAGEDLRLLLQSQAGAPIAPGQLRHAGALLFSCNGRGTRMFSEPNHDASCVRASFAGDLPVAGFFASGEVGPVGGRNFLHGFTASVAVFRAREGS